MVWPVRKTVAVAMVAVMKVGYARVSTLEQSLAAQHSALNLAGCDKVFEDYASGAKTDREGLRDALEYVRSGDTLVVWKLDRLGRSMKGLIELAGALNERGINLESITDGIDTNTAAGRFFFHIMAALATMERELILERTRAGLAAAREAGRVGGRPRKMTTVKARSAQRLLDAGTPPREVAATLGVSVATVYRYTKRSG